MSLFSQQGAVQTREGERRGEYSDGATSWLRTPEQPLGEHRVSSDAFRFLNQQRRRPRSTHRERTSTSPRRRDHASATNREASDRRKPRRPGLSRSRTPSSTVVSASRCPGRARVLEVTASPTRTHPGPADSEEAVTRHHPHRADSFRAGQRGLELGPVGDSRRERTHGRRAPRPCALWTDGGGRRKGRRRWERQGTRGLRWRPAADGHLRDRPRSRPT